VKFLIDECLHTSLVAVAQSAGHDCSHVNWLGLSGETDWDLMPRIVAEDFTFVTNNARDFLKLYAKEELHAGLVIIVPQVLPALQREFVRSDTPRICRGAGLRQRGHRNNYRERRQRGAHALFTSGSLSTTSATFRQSWRFRYACQPRGNGPYHTPLSFCSGCPTPKSLAEKCHRPQSCRRRQCPCQGPTAFQHSL
jgi:predicted nuclease of predicted toxin-antitoxin system